MQAQFNYTVTNQTVIITGYTDTNGVVDIPDAINGLPVTAIGDNAFYSSSLTSVTIPNSVISIGEGAFWGCSSLTSVTLPDSVTIIGGGVFSGCSSLTSVTIPKSVTSMGEGVFFQCSSLTNITVDPLNSVYSSLDGVLFNRSQTTLVLHPGGKRGNYTIPTSVVNIEAGAFAWCSLTSVTIPNSVASIGGGAFSGCSGLTSVTVPNSVTSIGNYVFNDCSSLTNVTIPNSITFIPDGAFSGCTSLASVTVPSSVISIGVFAFRGCGSLASVTIPNSVTVLGAGAFEICIGLTNVTIGDSVIGIGGEAFYDCISLAGVYFQGNAPSGDSSVFSFDYQVTAYYLPGATGWGPTFGGIPTKLWSLPYPLILNSSLGVRSNQFGFTVSWATNISVVVEASTDFLNPIWSRLTTNALAGGWFYFADPGWTKHPKRFYRVRSQ